MKILHLGEELWLKSYAKVSVVIDEHLSSCLMAGIVVLEPGQRLPDEGFSQHMESDELAFVVEGSAIFGREDGEYLIREFDLIFNPRGTKHYVRNHGNKPCKMLWMLAPPIKF